MLFQTQSNFYELVLFSICGIAFGLIFGILKKQHSIVFCSVFFATFAAAVVIASLQIPFTVLGYQTFLVPIATFQLAKTVIK